MATVYDVPADMLIDEIAKDLKERRKVPEPGFASFAKTGAHRERAPQRRDWWHVRCAAILRRIYVDGPSGTERLRTYYGGREARGVRPHHFRKAGGKVIRTCLQALEKEGFLAKKEKTGRIVTKEGQKYLNDVSKRVAVVVKQERTIEKRAELKVPDFKTAVAKAAESKKEQKGKKKKKDEEEEGEKAVRRKK